MKFSQPGPWDDEPDELRWIDDQTGFRCYAVRSWLGVWCGYVSVGSLHPWFEKSCEELGEIAVHGGLSFAGRFNGSIPKAWLVGFDCGHVFGYFPALHGPSEVTAYRDINYVRSQCGRLAQEALKACSIPVSNFGLQNT